ncbi:pyridoxal phosphate-dependent transferase [Aspergillus varians]
MVLAQADSTPAESRFVTIDPPGPASPLAMVQEYQNDPNPCKVNLLIGAYRDNDENPWQLTAVKETKRQSNLESLNHEYLPPMGSPEFLQSARLLAFGPTITTEANASMASIQTVGGTGANTLIAAFLQRHARPQNIWLPQPTWVNHPDIWRDTAPDVSIKWYPYYDNETQTLDFLGMMHTLATCAEENDAILLHACAHNPTGLDPSQDEWHELALLCKAKKLFVIFDLAYQGFASGDLDRDAWAVRHFCSHPGIEMAVCQSFSKNLGLYGERTGALHVVVARDDGVAGLAVPTIADHLGDLHRVMVSMAPRFGSAVAAQILGSEELRGVWKEDLLVMSGRVKEMRRALYRELARRGTPGSWGHILQQTGMFSYTGLGVEEVEVLKREYHIYLLPTGRASICGLTTGNVWYVAAAIHDVVTRGLSKK